MPTILTIDPGPTISAMAHWETDTDKGLAFIQDENLAVIDNMARRICFGSNGPLLAVVIEQVTPRGMPLLQPGRDMLIWMGRFEERALALGAPVIFIEYASVAKHLTGKRGAKQGQINAALTDRYGGKGTKKNPGILHEVKDHIWSAVGLAAFYVDELNGKVEAV